MGLQASFAGYGLGIVVEGAKAFQSQLNRFSSPAGFTRLVVDGDIGSRTANAAALAAAWIADNVGGTTGTDWLQILSSRDPKRLAAEAARLTGVLDGIANTMGLVEKTGLPASVKVPSTPSVTVTAPVSFPEAPAPTRSRGWLWAGLAAAGAGLYFLFGRKKKRRR